LCSRWSTIAPDELDAAYRQFHELAKGLLARASPIDVLDRLIEWNWIECA
jgi:hypothetical protein